jgi:MFS family permease
VEDTVAHWRALIVLGTAQFLMVLDTSVMNVSISQLVEDFDTEVTAIQGVITLYALVMAAFMLIGGRFGDILGRRRLFFLGLVVYGIGSAVTAVAPTLWVLGLGWSVIEGLGAAMVLPAMAALVAESYRGRDRAVAYGIIGGLARRPAARRLGDDVPGMGLLASQLGNVVQSSAGEEERSEVGGLQFTAQNLGSALGTALIGSLLIGSLAHAFTAQVEDDPRLSQEARQQTSVALQAGISFVPTEQVRTAAERAGLPPSEVDALADSYASAQLNGLKAAILATGGITLAAFLVTPRLPSGRKDPTAPPGTDGGSGPTPAAAPGSTRRDGD